MTAKRDNSQRVLVVDDDPSLLQLITLRLESAGYTVESAESAAAALSVMETFHPQLVITDLRMDEMDGIGLLEKLQERFPALPVLILTAHGTIPDAVTATQRGAASFLTKPIDKEQLLGEVKRAISFSGQGAESTPEAWRAGIVSQSRIMEEVLSQVRKVAHSALNVILAGESGTGKELLAAAVHRASPRHGGPFVAVNCAAIPDELLESELFGHTRGAFTGAAQARDGLIRAADGGTLFLDEIGDMPQALQPKLLRCLQDKLVRPLGSTRDEPVDVRIVAATHRDPEVAVKDGLIREDLYYRLNGITISVPPLRQRREDIPLLVAHFLEELSGGENKRRHVYAPEAMEMLVAADWPGNVRQLRNVVEQNVALAGSAVISQSLVRKALGEAVTRIASFAEARDEFTRSYLGQLLRICGGNVSRAARLARRNRTELYKLLDRHGIDPTTYRLEGNDAVASRRQQDD